MLALCLVLASVEARADGSTDPKRRAAALFEQGVRQFSEAKYETAARTFLAADELAPSSRALTNAITAARKANHHLLVARAAQRALERDNLESETAALARDALADAARSLSLIEVRCLPLPCSITLDGEPVPAGVQYALPGTHDFVGQGPAGGRAAEHLTSIAGASYRVNLKLTPSGRPARSSDGAAPRADAEAKASGRTKGGSEPYPATTRGDRPAEGTTKPLPPGVFWAGAAGTALLVGLSTWSGLEALSAKRADRDSYDRQEVQDLARRTDYFLLGAIILGGSTAAAGIWLVDWGSGTRAALAPLPGRGLAVAAEGRF